jgi:CRISPR/Cas system-associated exonuclease Cas4 (RecB family)
MPEAEPFEQEDPPVDTTATKEIVEAVSQQRFHKWFDERQTADNVLNGQAYFNKPAQVKPPEQHSPSQLLQCPRKMSYRRQNAPKEGEQPDGIFWVGSAIEEDLVVPFLQDAVASEDTYVANSHWVDSEVDFQETTLRIRGSTDPLITTETGEPLVVFEVKSTTSIDYLDGPKPHHRAQLHAYLYGLNNEYEHDVSDGVVLYVGRETLDVKAFHERFDPDFWARVVEWMAELTEYEASDELPPDDPVFDWECKYCDFRNRCGKTDEPYSDVGPEGLLPLYEEYGKANLIEYLQANENARLTPTLAQVFPDLAAEYGAYPWRCTTCGSTFQWDQIEPEDNNAPPYCPSCVEAGDLCVISGPDPETQGTGDSA